MINTSIQSKPYADNKDTKTCPGYKVSNKNRYFLKHPNCTNMLREFFFSHTKIIDIVILNEMQKQTSQKQCRKITLIISNKWTCHVKTRLNTAVFTPDQARSA